MRPRQLLLLRRRPGSPIIDRRDEAARCRDLVRALGGPVPTHDPEQPALPEWALLLVATVALSLLAYVGLLLLREYA